MNRIDLEGQVAVVTGGAQGLGFAIARRRENSFTTAGVFDLSGGRVTY